MKKNNFGMIEGKLVPFRYNEFGELIQVCLQLPTMQKVRLFDNPVNTELVNLNGSTVKLLGWVNDNGFITQDFNLSFSKFKDIKVSA